MVRHTGSPVVLVVLTVTELAGSDVSAVVQEITRLYGSDNLGIVTPAAIMQAQHHTQSGSSSFTLEVGFIAMLVSAIGSCYDSLDICK